MTQILFLSNSKNKSQFIALLCEILTRHNIQVPVTSTGADVLIVETAVESVTYKTVVLVHEDVDLIVIATVSCDLIRKLIFKKPVREGRWNQIYVAQIATNLVFEKYHHVLSCIDWL